MLDPGPLAWVEVEADTKAFGLVRIRYVILHFPLDKALEGRRTKYIGHAIKRNKGGDNDFLFRRISLLTQEIERVSKRGTELVHRNEKLKADLAKTQNRLAEAYIQIRSFEETRTAAI